MTAAQSSPVGKAIHIPSGPKKRERIKLSGAPRVSAFKHFPKGKSLGRTGSACPAFFRSGVRMRPRRMGVTQKQLGEVHIAIVKPQE